MATKTLTMAGIKSLRPGPQRREMRDGGAAYLYLIVQTSGHKSFAMRFRRPDGKTAKLVLGPVDFSDEPEGEPVVGQPLTLAAARRLAADIGRERARGKDVVADIKAAKQRAMVERDDRPAKAFASAVRDFAEHHAKKERPGRPRPGCSASCRMDRWCKGSLAERWADRPVAEIDGHDVYAVVEEARKHGIPGQGVKNDGVSESRGRHVFNALSIMFTWLHRHRRVEANPCAGVHRPEAPGGAGPRPDRRRDRQVLAGGVGREPGTSAQAAAPDRLPPVARSRD